MKQGMTIKKIIISVFAILFCAYFLYCLLCYINIFYAANFLKTRYLTEYLRINIYGKSYTEEGDTISAKIAIVDSNLNEITTVERSWNGSCLAVKFNQLEICGSRFYFPSKIYGKEDYLDQKIPKNITSLEKYYDENGQCILFSQTNTRKKERKALYVLSKFANHKYLIPTFGFINKKIVDLYDCKNGKFYSISADSNGILSIIEL